MFTGKACFIRNQDKEKDGKMTVKECYELMNADYEGVLSRLMKDERIEKYLHKFADGNYYDEISNALEAESWEDAFRAVHSLKGMSLNLGFENLHKLSDVLCEELRPCVKPENDISSMVSDVKEEYEKVIAAINAL